MLRLLVTLLLATLLVFVGLAHRQANHISYDVLQSLDFAEIRRYPAGIWLSVPVPNDNYALMMAYGYDVALRFSLFGSERRAVCDQMLLGYLDGENLSRQPALPLTLPMRVSMNIWDMGVSRFASFFLGNNSTELPAPRHPLFLLAEPEAFVYAKRIRSTDDLRTVIHHAACLVADLCMRGAGIDRQKVFVAYHAPENIVNHPPGTQLLDEVWVQWTGTLK